MNTSQHFRAVARLRSQRWVRLGWTEPQGKKALFERPTGDVRFATVNYSGHVSYYKTKPGDDDA